MLGLLAIVGIPTTSGLVTIVDSRRRSQSASGEEQQLRKFNLRCFCVPNTPSARRINNGTVTLQNSKLYIAPQDEKINAHLFEGFYLPYPGSDRPLPRPRGLVSTISNEPPVLNWIYVDRKTRELKYGNRTQSKENIIGSWGWDAGTEEGPGGLILEGYEAAVAIRTSEDVWEIRWEDERGEVFVADKEVVKVSLERKMLDPTEQGKDTRGSEREHNEGAIPNDEAALRTRSQSTCSRTADSDVTRKKQRRRRRR